IRDETGEDRTQPGPVDDRPDSRLVLDPLRSPRVTNVMSNGYYNVMFNATGTGYSRAGQIAVTRWNADPSEDRSGTFLFIADPDSGEWWSTTAEPRRMPDENCRAFFCDDKATFTKSVGTLRSEVECVVV